MKGKPYLTVLALALATLAWLLWPLWASGQEPTPTPIPGNRVESPFRSRIVPPAAGPQGEGAGFRPQGMQGRMPANWTPWVLVCCFLLLVLAVIWAVLFWLLGRGKAKPAPPPPTYEPPPPPRAPEPARAAPHPPAVPSVPPPRPAAAPSPPPASLTVQRGPQAGWRYLIAKSPVSIGSGPENDMVIADPQVSPRHAMVWREGDTYYAQDVGSTYGTFVNGTRLTQTRALADGDEISLGPAVVLKFRR